jgi:hypothetical protein
MSFFNQFPVRTYDADKDGIQDTVTDIFRYVDVDDNRIDSISSYIFYEIEDGERPDIVSQKLYGTPDYYWTFFVINDSLKHGLEDWPMSTQEFNDSMEENFSQFSSVQLRMNTQENQPVEFFEEIDSQGNVSNENKYAKQIIFPDRILQSLNPNVFIPPSDAQAKDSLTNTYNASSNTNGIGDITSVISSSYYAGDAGAALSADKSNQLAGIVLDSKLFIKNIDTDEVAKILNYDVNSSSVVFLRDTVSKVDIDTSGSGYQIPPKVIIAPSSTGETATALCSLGTGGKIDIVEVTTIGGGYKTVPPVVTLDEGPTSPAIVQPIVNNLGIITQLNIVDQGDGYCKKPILSILNPNSTDEFNAKLLLPPFDLNLTDGAITNWDAGDSQVEYEYDVTAKFFGKKVSVTIDKPFPMVYSLSNPVSFLFHLNTQVDAEQPSPTTPFYKVNDNYYDNYTDYYIAFQNGRWEIISNGSSYFFADEGTEGQPLQDIQYWYYGLDNDVYWNQTSDPNNQGQPYDPYEGVSAPITFTTVAIPKTSFNNSNIRVISLTEGGSVAGSNVPLTIVTAYVKAGYTLVSPGTFGFNIINPEETIYEDIGREDLLNMFSVGSFLYTPSKTFPIIERGEISSNELRLRIRSSDVTTLAKGVNILSDDDEMTSDDSEDITSGFLSGKIEDNYFDLFYNKKEPIVYLSPDKSNQSSLSARIIDEEWVQSLKAFSLVYQEETAKQKIENYKPVDLGTISYKSPITGLYTARNIDPAVGGIPVFIKPMVQGYDVYGGGFDEGGNRLPGTGKYLTEERALKHPETIEYFDTWKVSIKSDDLILSKQITIPNSPYEYTTSTTGTNTQNTNITFRMRHRVIPNSNLPTMELFLEGDTQFRNLNSNLFPLPSVKEYYNNHEYYEYSTTPLGGNPPYDFSYPTLGALVNTNGTINSAMDSFYSHNISNIVNRLRSQFGFDAYDDGFGNIQVYPVPNTRNQFYAQWLFFENPPVETGEDTGIFYTIYYSTGGTGYTKNIGEAKIYYSNIDSGGNETLEIIIPEIYQYSYYSTGGGYDSGQYIKERRASLNLKISIGPEPGNLLTGRETDTIGMVNSKGDLSSNTGVKIDDLLSNIPPGSLNPFPAEGADGRIILYNGNGTYKPYMDLLSYLGTRTFLQSGQGETYNNYDPVKLLKYDLNDQTSYISVPLSGKPTTEYSILFSLKTYTYVNGVVGTEALSSQDIQIEFKTDSAGLAVGKSVNVDPPEPGFIRRAEFVKIVSERPLGITSTSTYENTFLNWLRETRPALYLDAIRYSTRDNTINFAILNDYLSTKLVFSVDIANSKAGESVSYYKDKNGNIIDQALLTTAPNAERDLIQYKNLAGISS